MDTSPRGLKTYIESDDRAWDRLGGGEKLLAIWNGVVPPSRVCPWSGSQRRLARGEHEASDVCELPAPSGSHTESTSLTVVSITPTGSAPSTFVTSTIPFPRLTKTPSPTASTCFSSSTFTSCHYVGVGHGSVCVPASTCISWGPNNTPPPGTRCEQDSECSKYQCSEGSHTGCLVNAMGGVKFGTCQCLPDKAPTATEKEETPSTTSQPPTGTAPPARSGCNSASDCSAWVCPDGSKPSCDTQGSGDPFTQYCRCA